MARFALGCSRHSSYVCGDFDDEFDEDGGMKYNYFLSMNLNELFYFLLLWMKVNKEMHYNPETSRTSSFFSAVSLCKLYLRLPVFGVLYKTYLCVENDWTDHLRRRSNDENRSVDQWMMKDWEKWVRKKNMMVEADDEDTLLRKKRTLALNNDEKTDDILMSYWGLSDM